ncbi:hypothetical protein AAZX31_13G228800 [Glycine max]|uniref:F-box domain-containing protein n=1 Tax=Glycine max TaxID=3847 RepID=A0A0R0H1B6_SOYBN|nr:F-box protein At1g61340 [Glycine max]XP_028186604.1 F-box protein At1g61340-like [Glycine soja]KAG4960524.1 hypothetical protein JHK87_037157 [Glycine soja]KAG4971542.1 hypothetical protein JHK85_037963 [Glycine max]KAG4977930.1 hypothetical protein JHK86_037404 [Glycine max]KAG5113937.1 hypothetical protein JHK82_037206 [Glycine max]KAG5131218.1 hypothetical protein JHK84_037615 [Glycine max]|eukprot:XP_006595415.1 F-box protein At1g61340 [Glycine max]
MTVGFDGLTYTLTLGRKRVVVSDDVKVSPRLKRIYRDRVSLNSKRSLLDALPQDVLVQVLCGVDHEDLKQLFHVSKTIREATTVVKKLHFDISTPKKKTFGFLNPFDLEDVNGFEEIEAPNRVLRKAKSRLNRKKLDDNVLQVLFAFMDEDQ